MDDTCTYQIEVRGQADENDLNAMSTLPLTLERIETAATWFSVCTDQSGLIGLLRHLHARGLVFLSICREQ